MTTGVVFDIKELAIHDGPGLRTTVFLKGCPLTCTWCHNPEGIRPEPEVMSTPSGRRTVGTTYTSGELARRLRRQADVLRMNEGGVTFSGGEPLGQADFVTEVIHALDGMHVVLDTSGYAPPEVFDRVVSLCHLVLFDLKIMDDQLHRRYTGCGNAPILENLARLNELGTPVVVRVPLVPGVTDTAANLGQIARKAAGLHNLRGVDLLRYNRAAGGKYAGVGREYRPGFEEDAEVNAETTAFREQGLEVTVR